MADLTGCGVGAHSPDPCHLCRMAQGALGEASRISHLGTDSEVMAFPSPLSADVTEAQGDDEGGTLIARKVGEAVQNTLGAVVTAIDIPLGGPGSASRVRCTWVRARGVPCLGLSFCQPADLD